MARFNQPATPTVTENFAGGQAYTQSPELELVSILLTSFANEQYYRSANDTFGRIKELIKLCNKKFVAQLAIYARTKFGMRSISHVTASELAKYISGETWAKNFYSQVVYRPDDMMEILSYHTTVNGKITSAMKKGFALAFNKFDAYQLAKYRGEGKAYKLIDVVNLCHPVGTEKNKQAIEALVKGDLKSIGTWEAEMTKAGQEAETAEEKAEMKKDVWVKLIQDNKIAYFALLRNLRNIIEQAPEIIPQACEMLVNEKLIKKSLVLPFRYTTAYGEIQDMSGKEARTVLMAIQDALDISCSNVPKFEGDTLVVLDDSSSMGHAGISNKSPFAIGSLFAAALVKANNADLIMFSGRARYLSMNPKDTIISMTMQMDKVRTSEGTDFHSIFYTANRPYNRIIILSDGQGWVGYRTPVSTFNEWKKKYNCNPKIFSFDLQGLGTMQFPEPNVFAIAGFSDKILSIMGLMEQDKNALINEVKKISL